MPYKSKVTQITCDIGGGERGSAGLVELVEYCSQQGDHHLKGVERTAVRAGRGNDERARRVPRRHADDLAGQARQGVLVRPWARICSATPGISTLTIERTTSGA